MSRSSEAGNSVVQAAIQACMLRGVPVVRFNSGQFMGFGDKGRARPVAASIWYDDLGAKHTAGMPDLLARPTTILPGVNVRITVPLWIECKAGTSKLTSEQKAFREMCEAHHEHYIELRDSAEELMEWFTRNQVTR